MDHKKRRTVNLSEGSRGGIDGGRVSDGALRPHETGGRPPPIDRAIFVCGEAIDAPRDTLFLMTHQLEHGVSGPDQGQDFVHHVSHTHRLPPFEAAGGDALIRYPL